MKTKIIIQARTGSSRLPKKMIMPFYQNKSILEILIERIKKKVDISNIIVATTINEEDNSIERLCNNLGILCFRGSENNVLKRYVDAALQFNVEKIIRICADNIFIDISYLKRLMEKFDLEEYDYYSYQTINGTPSIITHYGLWAIEGVKTKALQKISQETNDKYYLEHVTNYIYNNPTKFNIRYITIHSKIQKNLKLRLTIDTQTDFEIMQNIYSNIIESNIELTSINIIKYLDSKQDIYDKMEEIIKNNTKK